MRIVRRFPNFFSGFETTEHEVNNLTDLMLIDWCQNVIDMGGTLEYSLSGALSGGPNYLMSVFSDKSYFVIGYIYGNPEEIGLKEWDR
jgi:hypothetical protein